MEPHPGNPREGQSILTTATEQLIEQVGDEEAKVSAAGWYGGKLFGELMGNCQSSIRVRVAKELMGIVRDCWGVVKEVLGSC